MEKVKVSRAALAFSLIIYYMDIKLFILAI